MTTVVGSEPGDVADRVPGPLADRVPGDVADQVPGHVDVLIVGAGLSGIGAAVHLGKQSPWASYTILEARSAIGGTWDLFRYPGIRSDSDMFTFGYSFKPWDSDQSLGEGADILNYIRDAATEYDVGRHIHFGHRVLSASWSSTDARWTVTVEQVATGETFEMTCWFLYGCTGYYRYDRGHTPDFAGIDDFQGLVVHPQHWPEDLDYTGKRVVVIGSGATAITLVPAMAHTAGGVTMVQRSPSYVLPLPAVNPLNKVLRRVLPSRVQGPVLRWYNALVTQFFYDWCQWSPRRSRAVLRRAAKQFLPPGFDVDTHFNPNYDPWDQRLCVAPDGDLFRAIKKGTADVVTDRIDRFTESGLLLASGRELEADIIVTATGLELLALGGIELDVDGEPVEYGDRMAYKAAMLEGVPNLAMAFGYTNASWTLRADLTSDFVARLISDLRAVEGDMVVPRPAPGEVGGRTPFLDLTSNYVQRSAHLFPKQGDTDPWKVYQRYLTDHRLVRRNKALGPGLEVSRRPAAPLSSVTNEVVDAGLGSA
jgi:cation diffusion facilitator CzcD-associated flavoprotein CzcO